jgi:hypothetical protein
VEVEKAFTTETLRAQRKDEKRNPIQKTREKNREMRERKDSLVLWF